VNLRENVRLAPYTTLQLGGPARYFVECAGESEVRAALAYARERGLGVFVLGGGSNIVFGDAGFPGVVLRVASGRTKRAAARDCRTDDVGREHRDAEGAPRGDERPRRIP